MTTSSCAHSAITPSAELKSTYTTNRITLYISEIGLEDAPHLNRPIKVQTFKVYCARKAVWSDYPVDLKGELDYFGAFNFRVTHTDLNKIVLRCCFHR